MNCLREHHWDLLAVLGDGSHEFARRKHHLPCLRPSLSTGVDRIPQTGACGLGILAFHRVSLLAFPGKTIKAHGRVQPNGGYANNWLAQAGRRTASGFDPKRTLGPHFGFRRVMLSACNGCEPGGGNALDL